MRLFDRRCAVTVGKDGEGTRVDERFRIEFKVTKSLSPDMNVSEVKIYGLGDDLRNQMLEPDMIVQIEAGYRDGTEVLTLADVTNAMIRREPPDIVVQLDCQDGATELREKKVSLSFAPDTPVERVLDKLAEELALGVRATGVKIEGVYRNGVTFNTTIRDAINRVTRKAGVTWSIQDRELQILDRVEAAEGDGVLLSASTGLIGSPERIDDPDKGDQIQRGVGYKVRSLLNPKIRPGDELILDALDVQGQFRIDTVEHRGDTRGNDWYTEAEVYGG